MQAAAGAAAGALLYCRWNHTHLQAPPCPNIHLPQCCEGLDETGIADAATWAKLLGPGLAPKPSRDLTADMMLNVPGLSKLMGGGDSSSTSGSTPAADASGSGAAGGQPAYAELFTAAFTETVAPTPEGGLQDVQQLRVSDQVATGGKLVSDTVEVEQRVVVAPGGDSAQMSGSLKADHKETYTGELSVLKTGWALGWSRVGVGLEQGGRGVGAEGEPNRREVQEDAYPRWSQRLTTELCGTLSHSTAPILGLPLLSWVQTGRSCTRATAGARCTLCTSRWSGRASTPQVRNCCLCRVTVWLFGCRAGFAAGRCAALAAAHVATAPVSCRGPCLTDDQCSCCLPQRTTSGGGALGTARWPP